MHGCGCCSMQCERKDSCALHDSNIGNCAVILADNYYTYGTCSINATESEEFWFCGPHGNWGMYRPLEE